VGKRAFKAYEKSEWGRDIVGAWGVVSFPHPLERRRELGYQATVKSRKV
jgi:hypothetical protein